MLISFYGKCGNNKNLCLFFFFFLSFLIWTFKLQINLHDFWQSSVCLFLEINDKLPSQLFAGDFLGEHGYGSAGLQVCNLAMCRDVRGRLAIQAPSPPQDIYTDGDKEDFRQNLHVPRIIIVQYFFHWGKYENLIDSQPLAIVKVPINSKNICIQNLLESSENK